MKLILLPGMDGTGKLFENFISCLSEIDCSVIPLPQSGPQDVTSLSQCIREQLPSENFFLLAESFSGAIAAKLCEEPITNLRGMVFVGSFLSPPNRVALSLARALPIKILSKLPFSIFAIRKLMLGPNASDSLVEKFRNIIDTVPRETLKARFQAMQSLGSTNFSSDIPVLYLSGSGDHLVPRSKQSEFEQNFPNVEFSILDGPHFLLQTNPEASAQLVIKFTSRLTK